MQDLYEAVTVLHRSREDVRRNGWICATIGSRHGPKCISGVVGVAAKPDLMAAEYIVDVAVTYPELKLTLKLVTRALAQTVPEDVRLNVLENVNRDSRAYLGLSFPLIADLDCLQEAIVAVNDATNDCNVRLMTETRVLLWLEAAQDLLAQELPEPIPAVRQLVF